MLISACVAAVRDAAIYTLPLSRDAIADVRLSAEIVMTWDSSLHWRNVSTTEFVVDYSYYRFLSTTSPNRCSPSLGIISFLLTQCLFRFSEWHSECLLYSRPLLLHPWYRCSILLKFDPPWWHGATHVANFHSKFNQSFNFLGYQNSAPFLIFNTIWAFWLVRQINQSWVLSPAHEKRGDAITLDKSCKPSVFTNKF